MIHFYCEFYPMPLDPEMVTKMDGNYLAYSIFTEKKKGSPASQCFRKKTLAGQFHFLFMGTVICHFFSFGFY